MGYAPAVSGGIAWSWALVYLAYGWAVAAAWVFVEFSTALAEATGVEAHVRAEGGMEK